jgi:hypothetical protein
VLGVSHKANHFGLNDESSQKRLDELLDHLKNRGYSHKNIEQDLSASKAISIDQLAEHKVRQSIERQRLCIQIILTSVVSYTSSVYNWSTSSSFQTISRVSVNDFQITDKIEIMRAAVISKTNIPHLGIVKVV